MKDRNFAHRFTSKMIHEKSVPRSAVLVCGVLGLADAFVLHSFDGALEGGASCGRTLLVDCASFSADHPSRPAHMPMKVQTRRLKKTKI